MTNFIHHYEWIIPTRLICNFIIILIAGGLITGGIIAFD